LIVDDERVVREVIRNLLDRPGMYLIDVEDGEAAIELLLKEPFDLLIADKNLPGITGLDVIRRAKAVDRNMSTLLITAFASRESAEEAMAIGVDDYLIKPFELSDLEKKVEEAIERRQQRADLGRDGQPAVEAKAFERKVMVCEPAIGTRNKLVEGVKILGHQPMVAAKMADVLEALRNRKVDALICNLEVLNTDNAASCFLRSTLLVSPELRFVAVAKERGLDGAVDAIHHGAGMVIYEPFTDGFAVADCLRRFLSESGAPEEIDLDSKGWRGLR
jgi:DNA-binding NtrC family response regulator